MKKQHRIIDEMIAEYEARPFPTASIKDKKLKDRIKVDIKVQTPSGVNGILLYDAEITPGSSLDPSLKDKDFIALRYLESKDSKVWRTLFYVELDVDGIICINEEFVNGGKYLHLEDRNLSKRINAIPIIAHTNNNEDKTSTNKIFVTLYSPIIINKRKKYKIASDVISVEQKVIIVNELVIDKNVNFILDAEEFHHDMVIYLSDLNFQKYSRIEIGLGKYESEHHSTSNAHIVYIDDVHVNLGGTFVVSHHEYDKVYDNGYEPKPFINSVLVSQNSILKLSFIPKLFESKPKLKWSCGICNIITNRCSINCIEYYQHDLDMRSKVLFGDTIKAVLNLCEGSELNDKDGAAKNSRYAERISYIELGESDGYEHYATTVKITHRRHTTPFGVLPHEYNDPNVLKLCDITDDWYVEVLSRLTIYDADFEGHRIRSAESLIELYTKIMDNMVRLGEEKSPEYTQYNMRLLKLKDIVNNKEAYFNIGLYQHK